MASISSWWISFSFGEGEMVEFWLPDESVLNALEEEHVLDLGSRVEVQEQACHAMIAYVISFSTGLSMTSLEVIFFSHAQRQQRSSTLSPLTCATVSQHKTPVSTHHHPHHPHSLQEGR